MVPDETPSSRPPRRRRYRGTHPRRFDEKYKEHEPQRYAELEAHVRAQGRTPAGTHVPIMVAEVCAALRPAPGEVAVDCTLGYGGHAAEFLRRLAPGGHLIGCDVDAAQLDRAVVRLAELAEQTPGTRFTACHTNFAGLPGALARVGPERADVIFVDLGVSSMQIDDPARGFSYKHPGPLDMRMDRRIPLSAADWLARLTAFDLARILREYGDEPDAEAIAQEITAVRATRPLATTNDLVRVVAEVKGLRVRRNSVGLRVSAAEAGDRRRRETHPAARTFQALRMHVNDERGALRSLLRVLPGCLRAGGRFGVLAFHSGEQTLIEAALGVEAAAGRLELAPDLPRRPTAEEMRCNPRARPARLYIAVRTMAEE